MDRLRARVDRFLTALEQERHEVDLSQRRRPEVGALYASARDLFAAERITEVQRALAGSSGVEERQNRALLEFLARGRALALAGEALDQRLGWEVFGSVPVEENRIPVRQIEGALAVAADPERRHHLEDAYLTALDEHSYLAADFIAQHRDAIGELGYGSHVDTFQVLGAVDLEATAREGARLVEETEGLYRELLAYHLPRHAGVAVGEARASDGVRLEAAAEYDAVWRGGEGHRAVLEAVASAGIDPVAEGRIVVEWEAYLGVAAGAVCRPVQVPDEVRLSVSPRSGRPAVSSFLRSYGFALHHAYTERELPVEHRRLGDESVPLAAGALLGSLLGAAPFLMRVYGVPRAKVPEYVALEALCGLLQIRRDVGTLQFELAFYADDAEPDAYAESLTAATLLRHDPRAGIWSLDPAFASARRLRAAQLGATLALALRNRFDEDWFRNPAAGPFLQDLFCNGRRYSAGEIAVQLSSSQLSWAAVSEGLNELV